jgi:hypothetical protein
MMNETGQTRLVGATKNLVGTVRSIDVGGGVSSVAGHTHPSAEV